MGVFYRHEQGARADNGRGVLDDKAVVSWQARRSNWAPSCAQNIVAMADCAPWCWNLINNAGQGTRPLLDFYHATQHLWEASRAAQRARSSDATRRTLPRTLGE